MRVHANNHSHALHFPSMFPLALAEHRVQVSVALTVAERRKVVATLKF